MSEIVIYLFREIKARKKLLNKNSGNETSFDRKLSKLDKDFARILYARVLYMLFFIIFFASGTEYVCVSLISFAGVIKLLAR